MQNQLTSADRAMRLFAGILSLSCALEQRRGLTKAVLTTVGAAKIAEGAIGWCPLQAMVQALPSKNAEKSQQRNTSSKNGATGAPTANRHVSGTEPKKKKHEDNDFYRKSS